MALKAFKTALRTNKAQEAFFETCANNSRFVYNKYLEHRNSTYQARLYLEDIGVPDAKLYTQTPNTFYSSKWLTDLKSRYPWLYDGMSQSLTGSMHNCDTAFKNFFENLKLRKNKANSKTKNPKSKNKSKKPKSGLVVGYPQFKRKYGSRASFYVNNQNLKVTDDAIILSKIGKVRLFEKGYIPTNRKVTFANISKEDGRWFISVTMDVVLPTPTEKPFKSAGIDMGLSNWMVLSDGTTFENPRYFKKGLKKLRKINRAFSRAKLGSKRWLKVKAKLAHAHAYITNQRNDSVHKATSYLTKTYSSLIIEDLNIKGLMKTRLAKSFADVSIGETVRCLKYKGLLSGCEIKKVPRFFPSSKLCSKCGWKNDELTLSDREWLCKNCGVTHDRDINAAINLATYFERFGGDNQALWCSNEDNSLESEPKRPEAGQTFVMRGPGTSRVLEKSAISSRDETQNQSDRVTS